MHGVGSARSIAEMDGGIRSPLGGHRSTRLGPTEPEHGKMLLERSESDEG